MRDHFKSYYVDKDKALQLSSNIFKKHKNMFQEEQHKYKHFLGGCVF